MAGQDAPPQHDVEGMEAWLGLIPALLAATVTYWRTRRVDAPPVAVTKNDDSKEKTMGWFGNEQPILGSGTPEERRTGNALRKAGYDTFAVKGIFCQGCGGEDGAHVPGEPCENVN